MEIEQKFQERIRDYNRKKEIEEKIEVLEGQLQYLHGRELKHKNGMEEALANSDKLSGTSLSFVLEETKKPSSALNENRRNAYKEAVNYESIVCQIKAVESDLEAERRALKALDGAEERYEEILKEYKEFYRERNSEYVEIQKRIADYDSYKATIRAAIDAGLDAQAAADLAYAELQETRRLMKKTFVFASSRKKQINSTQKSIESLQIAVRRFTNELIKVQALPDSGPIRDERFLKFADYFFDDIFLVSDKDFDMNFAIGKVEMIRWTLEEAGDKLTKVLGMTNHKRMYLQKKQSEMHLSRIY